YNSTIFGMHEGTLLVSAQPELKWSSEALSMCTCQHPEDIVIGLKKGNVARAFKLHLDDGQCLRRRIAQYRNGKLAPINELFHQHRLSIGLHKVCHTPHQGGKGFDHRVVRQSHTGPFVEEFDDQWEGEYFG